MASKSNTHTSLRSVGPSSRTVGVSSPSRPSTGPRPLRERLPRRALAGTRVPGIFSARLEGHDEREQTLNQLVLAATLTGASARLAAHRPELASLERASLTQETMGR